MSSQSRKALARSAEFPGSVFEGPAPSGRPGAGLEATELSLGWWEALGIALFVAAAVATFRLLGF
jgi:hypothetical protein